MAAIAQIPNLDENPKPTRKGRSRKALKQANPSPNESNMIVQEEENSPVLAPPQENSLDKENHESLSNPKSKKKTKKGASSKSLKQPISSFERELQEMQERLEKLKLEKLKTEEMLRATEESLKQKEEEIETRDKEQDKLKAELKKLQKMKEFKPTMTLPLGFQLKDQEQEKKKSTVKKPSPAYVLWCKDQWNKVKKANPEADFKEMSNLMATKWKTAPAEEKKPYEEKYQADKEVYMKVIGHEKREKEAMKLLEEEHKQKTAMELLEQYLMFKQETEKENKKQKKEKDPLKPKQPLSAYFIFCNERRAALVAENKNVLEIAKITSEEWKSMSEKKKEPYEKMAQKNKEQYFREMEVYKQKKEEEAANVKKEEEEIMKLQKQEALQLLKKKEKTDNLIKKTKEERQKHKKDKGEKNVDPNKPKKPASSFILFSKETRKILSEERPEINNSTLNALISVKWKELSDEERRIWNDKAAIAMAAYKKELEEYNKKVVAEAETKD